MATRIINNGETLKVIIGEVTRLIVKTQIREITIIKTNVVKIDIGQGINNLFIPYTDVVLPATAAPDALAAAINDMLTDPPVTGGATERKQDDIIEELGDVMAEITSVKTQLEALNGKIFYDALLVDESTPDVIYRGFALPGASTSAPVWAIEKTTTSGDVTLKKWAAGSKSMTQIWDNRESLTYS